MKFKFTPNDGSEPISCECHDITITPTNSGKKYEPIICGLEMVGEVEFQFATKACAKKLMDQHDAAVRRIMWDELEAQGWRELRSLFQPPASDI